MFTSIKTDVIRRAISFLFIFEIILLCSILAIGIWSSQKVDFLLENIDLVDTDIENLNQEMTEIKIELGYATRETIITEEVTPNYQEDAPSEIEVSEDRWDVFEVCEPTYYSALMYYGTDSLDLARFLQSNGYDSDFSIDNFEVYSNSNGSKTYEVWQVYAFSEDTITPEKARYLTSYLPTVIISSLEELPQSDEIYVYNQNGYLGRNTSYYSDPLLEVPYRCLEDRVESIDWAPENELRLITTSAITYSYTSNGVVSDGFVTALYMGNELTQEEINHLLIRANGGDVLKWVESGFIGGGNSSFGNYDFSWDPSSNLQLVWTSPASLTGLTATPSHPVVPEVIPWSLGREIVSYTEWFSRDPNGGWFVYKTDTQRFVMTLSGTNGEQLYMLELVDETPVDMYPDQSFYLGLWEEALPGVYFQVKTIYIYK